MTIKIETIEELGAFLQTVDAAPYAASDEESRAARAVAAVLAYHERVGGDLDSLMGDMLADFIHLADFLFASLVNDDDPLDEPHMEMLDVFGGEFENWLEHANRHYNDERETPDAD